MTGGGGSVIALPMTLLAGLLMLSSVQASDIANSSKSLGFSFEYMSSRSESSKSSIGDTGKLFAHHLKHMEHVGRPEATSDHNDLVETAPATPTVDSPFMTYSDKLVHPLAPTQDTLTFASAQAGAIRSGKHSEPQKIADNKEDTYVQKLLSNESSKPIEFSAIVVAVALLSLAAMVGVRMRRRMQPAIALAGSSGHGNDMSIPLATAVSYTHLTLPTTPYV